MKNIDILLIIFQASIPQTTINDHFFSISANIEKIINHTQINLLTQNNSDAKNLFLMKYVNFLYLLSVAYFQNDKLNLSERCLTNGYSTFASILTNDYLAQASHEEIEKKFQSTKRSLVSVKINILTLLFKIYSKKSQAKDMLKICYELEQTLYYPNLEYLSIMLLDIPSQPFIYMGNFLLFTPVSDVIPSINGHDRWICINNNPIDALHWYNCFCRFNWEILSEKQNILIRKWKEIVSFGIYSCLQQIPAQAKKLADLIIPGQINFLIDEENILWFNFNQKSNFKILSEKFISLVNSFKIKSVVKTKDEIIINCGVNVHDENFSAYRLNLILKNLKPCLDQLLIAPQPAAAFNGEFCSATPLLQPAPVRHKKRHAKKKPNAENQAANIPATAPFPEITITLGTSRGQIKLSFAPKLSGALYWLGNDIFKHLGFIDSDGILVSLKSLKIHGGQANQILAEFKSVIARGKSVATYGVGNQGLKYHKQFGWKVKLCGAGKSNNLRLIGKFRQTFDYEGEEYKIFIFDEVVFGH